MSPFRLALLLPLLLLGCASAPPAVQTWEPRRLLAYDDGRAEGEIAFPNMHHESVVRFALPEGDHRLGRVWLRVAASGSLRLAVYASSALEGPGELLFETSHPFAPEDSSTAEEGRWWTVELGHLPPQKGVIWVGLKKTAGDPKIWASRHAGEHYFVRSDDPSAPLELLPVRRTPLLRLELRR